MKEAIEAVFKFPPSDVYCAVLTIAFAVVAILYLRERSNALR